MDHLYLAHHGIKGQHWGERLYQYSDGSLTPAGKLRYRKNYDPNALKNIKTSFGKTRYTNIDGSLNERGKVMVNNFASKEIERNNKYYDKYVSKYKKAYEKVKDPELKKRFKSMIDDAENSREKLNKSIGELSVNDIVTIKNDRNMKKLKIAGAITGTAGVAGLLAYTEGDPHKLIDDAMDWSRKSDTGRSFRKLVDGSIRTAVDARAYVTALFADETLARAQELGTFDRLNNELNKGSKNISNNIVDMFKQLDNSTPQTRSAINESINNFNNSDMVNEILKNIN